MFDHSERIEKSHRPLVVAPSGATSYALPRAEVGFPVGDGQDNLLVDEQALQVAVAVRLAGPVMAVILAVVRQPFCPFVNVVQNTRLVVVDEDPGRDVHRGDEDHALLHAALLHALGNRVGDPHVLAVLRRIEPEVVGPESPCPGSFSTCGCVQSASAI